MKDIRKVGKVVVGILSSQRKEEGVKYVEHPYLVKNGNAVYNSLTGEAVLVEDWEKDRDELIKRWFYVPEDFDVNSLSYLIRQKHRKMVGGSKTSFIIFTTTACNAHCEYCFEKGIKTDTMSEDTALKVAKYLIDNAPKNNEIKIKWFGGEPLLNKKVMNLICEKLKEADIKYWCELSTNGDLLPSCSDEEIRLWNPRIVQFTADSVGDEYERIKGLPAGSYERLKKNVERLGAFNGLRINFRLHLNQNWTPEVCYKIIDDFKEYKHVSLYVRLLYDDATLDDYKELLKIEDYIIANTARKTAFPIPIFNTATHCMADNPKVACITATGELTPCEHYPYGEHLYGSVDSKEIDKEILKKWTEKEKYVKTSCKTCPLYPSCRKIILCPVEGVCSDGYQYYQIETIKRALRKKVEEINGCDSNTNNRA